MYMSVLHVGEQEERSSTVENRYYKDIRNIQCDVCFMRTVGWWQLWALNRKHLSLSTWSGRWCGAWRGLRRSADENYFTKPPRMKKTMKSRPRVVFAQTSPYPTVDIVTMSKYTHSQYESGWEFWKFSQGSPEFSTCGRRAWIVLLWQTKAFGFSSKPDPLQPSTVSSDNCHHWMWGTQEGFFTCFNWEKSETGGFTVEQSFCCHLVAQMSSGISW